jgi:hypothetical protein
MSPAATRTHLLDPPRLLGLFLAVYTATASAAARGPSAGLTLAAAAQSGAGLRVATVAAATAHSHRLLYGRRLAPQPLALALTSLERADADQAAARSSLQQTRTLHTQHLATQARLDAARAAEASARLAQIQARLRWSALSGPTLDDLKPDAIHALRLALQQDKTALIRAAAPAGTRWPQVLSAQLLLDDGKTVALQPLGPASRSARSLRGPTLLFKLADPAPTLLPGMPLQIRLTTPAAPGVEVPGSALIHEGGQVAVFRQTDADHFVWQPVSLLNRQSPGLWRVRGLHPGDRIVVAGNAVLWWLREHPGAKVEAGDGDDD